MPIPTSRTTESAHIHIDLQKCTGCGLCVKVCKDFSLVLANGKAAVNASKAVFGCIGCGHCMAICPTGAINIEGRTLSSTDVFDLPPKESASSYDQLMALFQRRRSVREFKDKEVEPELIEKILAAARTAPMGLPPSDVHVLVLNGKDKVFGFSKDFCNYMRSMKWLVSGWFLAIMRPFWGKSNDAMFRNFVKPLFKVYVENMDKGINYVTYDAPLAIYFYGSSFTDPADPIVAATYAMHAGESLGLGTCMLGAMHPLIQNGRKARKFRESHGIKYKSREGLFVVFGYPDVKYNKGIRRTFAEETIL